MKNNLSNKTIDGKIAIALILTIFLLAIITISSAYQKLISESTGEPYTIWHSLLEISFPKLSLPKLNIPTTVSNLEDIRKFSSEEDFKNYLQESQAQRTDYYYGGGQAEKAETSGMGGATEAVPAPERISETNVQVAGIDEPDIVKTNGQEIYFSQQYFGVIREPMPLLEQAVEKIMPPWSQSQTKVIKAFPPKDLETLTEIDKSGDLLLNENILAVFSQDGIYGYDVSNSKSPQKKWEVKFNNNSYLVGARLYKNKIYLVTQQLINEIHPCPIKPLSVGGQVLEITCNEIYHPVSPVPVDTNFITMVLNPASGKIEKSISFVGSSGQSMVYMSKEGIYVTYFYSGDMLKFFSDFLKEKCRGLIAEEVITKIEKLTDYDISQQSKISELNIVFQKYLNSLENDEKLRIENELSNRMSDYFKTKKRDLEKTGIIKIGLDNFAILASGNVPGYPLNQFALDEYEENLRIAVTVGERNNWSWVFGFGFGRGESTNDVYVLDKNLKIEGQISDLGLTERVYSARFIEDKGYLVTFRQTDPFYVLDLSNPQKPELKGELKIPGYSAYLHPITKDKILGVGSENWQVKISLFDVSSPDKPKELNKYTLNESWSDILSTHHAFLLDEKHQIFFLPGSNGGYVFSYQNDKLELKRAVSDILAKRAIYLNDYLYIIGEQKIVVLNELNWEKINELNF